MNILTQTADGSKTLFNPEIGEHYHSSNGALQESKHVFIDAGLRAGLSKFGGKTISIFEVGFGTGLNFLLTYDYCLQHKIELTYHAVEAFPLTLETLESTGYSAYVSADTWAHFTAHYQSALQQETTLSKYCTLQIHHCTLQEFSLAKQFEILYYDAFSVRHQPELWTDDVIAKACSYILPEGIFVTYAITGNLKRAVKACDFAIEKLPGAPGKREMLRAQKQP